MEVFAAIGVISSIVQLVDFSSRCISKGIDLHRSASGILDDNASIGLTLGHLVSLNDELATATTSLVDVSLLELCKAVSQAATELADVLQQLKVCGQKTKWKTMRKAIKSVWSIEKVQDLEKRLANFRDEVNLHIAVKTREQLSRLELDSIANIRRHSEATQTVLDAIVAQQDVFSCIFAKQLTMIESGFKDIEQHTATSHTATRVEIKDAIADATLIDEAEHDITRQHIADQGATITQANAESQKIIVEEIALVGLDVQRSIDGAKATNSIERESTQSQIAELQEALRLLSQQISERDQELKQLLTAFQSTKSPKKRKSLGERSNAVTASLMALETMYRCLQRVLAQMQASAKRLLNAAQSPDIWSMTAFARLSVRPESAANVTTSTNEPSDLQQDIDAAGFIIRNRHLLTDLSIYVQPIRFPHKFYCSYHYPWIDWYHSDLVDFEVMEYVWPDTSPNYAITSSTPWLLVSVVVALQVCVPQYNTERVLWDLYGLGDRTGVEADRLRNDIRASCELATKRRMICYKPACICPPQHATIHITDRFLRLPDNEEIRDLRSLIAWVIGKPQSNFSQTKDMVKLVPKKYASGPAYAVAKCLRSLGLNMKVMEVKIEDSNCAFVSYDRRGFRGTIMPWDLAEL